MHWSLWMLLGGMIALPLGWVLCARIVLPEAMRQEFDAGVMCGRMLANLRTEDRQALMDALHADRLIRECGGRVE